MITDIRVGKRPSCPIDPSQSQWFQGPVWDAITTGWHHEPSPQCDLSVMYHAFLPPSQQEVQDFYPSDLNAQNDGNLIIVEASRTPKRQPGKLLPGIATFFQFLQNPDCKFQRRVDEMNVVSLFTSLPLKTLHESQRLENDNMSDRERLKLLKKLCKTCSRYHVIPTPMHIADCSGGSTEAECTGFANLSQDMYEGRRVAIKVVCMYVTSDLDRIRSVSDLPTPLFPSG